jgi:glycine cleavage system aminomethyltransferase T
VAGRRTVIIGAGVVGAVLADEMSAELAAVGTEVEIGYFDRRIPAIVTAEPLVDPKMTRLRG